MATKLSVSLKSILRQVIRTPEFRTSAWNYDNYWEAKRGERMGAPNAYQKYRAQWIADRIVEGSEVMDIGSGDGAQLMEIQRRRPVQATAVDCSEAALKHLRSAGIQAYYCDISQACRLRELPKVDHVLLLEVIEHTPTPEDLLVEARGRARTSVIFSIPNTGFIAYRLRLLFGRFPVQWRSHPGEHLRFWTYDDLIWWIRQLDLTNDTEIHAYEGVPVLNRLWPSLFAAGLIAEVRSKRLP
jgi:2-polyprenyl-3-methyl-5-hydroxy-6-metoxy-1,4-benzoquinol methylase